ncbi:MAG: peptidylprolyl isomerase [Alphaproteobacteria bacterium]|nr:peptidylprolyl isomerase [Alphaproteobacteria bacterium]
MKKTLCVTALAMLLSTVAVASLQAQDKDDLVVATVNGTKIMRSEVVRELQSMGPQAMQIPPEIIYPKLLERAIVTKLLSAKGYDDKLQNDPEVKARLKDVESQLVADAYVRKTIRPKITDAKVKARYDELVAKFKPEEEIRARHILVATEAEAKDIIKQIKGGADIAKLAAEKSKDSGSAKQGGDLGFFTKQAMVKPFADAAFAMKKGEVSTAPVKTDFGWHVIKVEERRKSPPPALDEVKEQITNQVGQEMANQMIEEMEAKAKIERFNIDGTPMKQEPAKKK